MSAKFVNKNKAFTLIELVVVVGIIGLLIAISVAFLGDAKSRGGDAGKIRALGEVRNALNAYFNDAGIGGGNGGYPPGSNPSVLSVLKDGKYILAIDPSIFYYNSDGRSFHLAVILTADNKVLTTDSDSSVLGFPGLSANCLTEGSLPDRCYDITQ